MQHLLRQDHHYNAAAAAAAALKVFDFPTERDKAYCIQIDSSRDTDWPPPLPARMRQGKGEDPAGLSVLISLQCFHHVPATLICQHERGVKSESA